MKQFGNNVRLARMAKQLSLQQLSDISGVSRTMLSEVERGNKVPTIDIASKIADALDVNLLALMGTKGKAKVAIVREKDRLAITQPNGKSSVWLLSPSSPTLGLDYIFGILRAGNRVEMKQPHKAGTGEYLLVAQGYLEVRLGKEEVFQLNPNDLIYFDGDIEHEVYNAGPEDCHYFCIIDYPRRGWD